MQFGSSNTAVFFKMRVAGVLHIFQFETKQVVACLLSVDAVNHLFLYIFFIYYLNFLQGEEICVALQTHINDVMLRRYSKARSTASGSINGDLNTNLRAPNLDIYENRVQDLSKALEESQKNANHVSIFFWRILPGLYYYIYFL